MTRAQRKLLYDLTRVQPGESRELFSRLSSGQYTKLCKNIDDRVNAFLNRLIESEWPYILIPSIRPQAIGDKPLPGQVSAHQPVYSSVFRNSLVL